MLRRLPYLAPTTSPSGANNSSPFTRPDANDTLPNGALHPPPDGVGVGVGSTVAWANMTGVAVGGTGVAVGGTGVAVGGTGVLVDGGGGGLLGKGVEVGNGGTGVDVGEGVDVGSAVAVGTGVAVAGRAILIEMGTDMSPPLDSSRMAPLYSPSGSEGRTLARILPPPTFFNVFGLAMSIQSGQLTSSHSRVPPLAFVILMFALPVSRSTRMAP